MRMAIFRLSCEAGSVVGSMYEQVRKHRLVKETVWTLILEGVKNLYFEMLEKKNFHFVEGSKPFVLILTF